MAFLGFTFYGPHSLMYYWYVNPWQVRTTAKIIPKAFFNTVKKSKTILLSIFFDLCIYPIPFLPTMIFYCGLIKYYGDYKRAWADVKRKVGLIFFASFGYYAVK